LFFVYVQQANGSPLLWEPPWRRGELAVEVGWRRGWAMGDSASPLRWLLAAMAAPTWVLWASRR